MDLRTWWKAWGQLVLKFVAIAGSLASLIGVLVPYLPPLKNLPWWGVALFVLATMSVLLLIALELHTDRGHRVYARSDTDGIRAYMHTWIEHGGRVAIWTRDMSWADNSETRNILMGKAGRRELILCLPEANELANKLAAAGAEICAYGANCLESPASRFTIIFFGRDGARVAVGRADGDTHVIDEFNAGGHPAFYLAEDLIALARAKGAGRQAE